MVTVFTNSDPAGPIISGLHLAIPGHGDTGSHLGLTSVTMSRCGEVKTRDNRSGGVTVSEQCNDILMLPRWVPETPGPGEAQVGPET